MNKQEFISNKIFDKEKLARQLHIWRLQSKIIVFTNGCFDLLHAGHIDYLSKAASIGDVLIVALNSDSSVSGNKGPGRPITNEFSRARIMASLFFVNAVILFDEETPLDLIKFLKPDVLVKGGDYKKEDIVGYAEVIDSEGEVITIDLLPGYSTTSIEQKILNSKR